MSYIANQQQQQISSSPSQYGSSPTVTMISSYIKSWFGLQPKITKRTLSEEAECGSPESLSEWLRKGSDVNEVDAYGYTPLVNASLRGCIKSVKVLLNNGAEVDKRAIHGYTALHAAAQNGHLDVVNVLLEHGANIESRNEDGDTPLMLAVRSEHPQVVDLLCTKGSNIHALGYSNQDPIDYAMSKRNLFMSDVLMKHERHLLNSTSSFTSMNDSFANSSFSSNNNNNLPPQPSSDSLFHSDP